MYIEDYIINNRLNLFIDNYEKIKQIKGFFGRDMMDYSIALSQTIKNNTINPQKIEQNVSLIKEHTGWFSNFRGHSMHYLAALLSTKENPTSELKSVLNIYDKLKENKFRNDTYLAFVAIIINENKDKVNVDECIERTKYVYEYMKKNHPLLTSSDDYARATLIAIHSKDLENDLEYIEESYKNLNNKGFFKSNNLQSLSHIMTFNKNRTEESIDKVISLREILKRKDCNVDGYGYPLIGALSLIDCNEEKITNQIKSVSDKLKDVKGFGTFSLGKSNRNMVSMAIVASCYSDSTESGIDTISNNIFVEIIIAIEIATMMAIIAASSAAASSGS